MTTIEAIDLALKTYNRLWEKGIDESTLASAKAYVKGKFPPKFEVSLRLGVAKYVFGLSSCFMVFFSFAK